MVARSTGGRFGATKKTFFYKEHSKMILKNHLGKSDGGNYLKMRFFNEDGFMKSVLETTIS